MAAKKQQNRVNSDKKTANSKTTARSNTSKTAESRRRHVPEPEPESEGLVRWEFIVLGSFAAAVILFLSNFHLCGIAGSFLRSVQLGLFGLPGYIAPLLLFTGICLYQVNSGSRRAVQKIIAAAAAFFLLCGFAQMICGKQPEDGKGIFEYYRLSAASGLGGGLMGGFLFGFVRSLIGGIGAFLFMAVGLILCIVCITQRSFVKAVRRHSDVAYQYAKEDMERRREVYAQRQEERKKLREEQRVRGVNLSSTKLSPAKESYPDDTMEDGYEDYEDSYENSYENNDDNRYDDNYEEDYKGYETESNDSAASDPYDPQEYVSSVREPNRRRMSPAEAMEPDFSDFSHMQSERAYAGSDQSREAEKGMPEYDSSMETEDDYDLEAAARRLTQSGFGRFEQAGEVFTGGARRLDERQEMSYEPQAGKQVVQDEAPWDEPDTYTEPFDHNYDSQNEGARTYETEKDSVITESFEELPDPYRSETDSYAKNDTMDDDLVLTQEPVFQEPDLPDDLADPDTTKTVSAGQNMDFAIPEASKRVVTAGGKVIETDTEALSKKLESAKKAELARQAEEAASTEKSAETQIREKQEQPKQIYVKPPLDLLKRGVRSSVAISNQENQQTAMKLEQTLRNFGVGVTVTNISCGPSVTRYELHPEQGVKVSKIVSLADDIKLSLAAEDIRIEAPIPGKSAVGIEVPNKEKAAVFLRDLLESEAFQKHPSGLAFAVGKDIGGQVVVTDIAKMPHLLIAGATGSGKSVCINTIIMSIIYKAHPDDVKLIMIDPKVVELSVYNGIPHLMMDVVTDPKKASGALNWAVAEMTDRYKKFAKYGVRDLKGYNAKIESIADIEDDKKPIKMSQIVIIVDELADLMMVAPGEVEDAICRLAQLARAAGIHLVIATQRPSVNVITGLIKANVPSRIAFSVSSGVDSRTIIDMNGAEKLLGKGDMLFYPAGFPKPQRVQGAFVSDGEVQKVVDFLTEQGFQSQNSPDVENSMNMAPSASASSPGNSRDEYFEQAGRFIIEKEKASIGMLQRMFKIGFNRAARIMDQLAEAGVVGEEEGTKPRKVLMTMEEFDQIL